MNRRPRHYECLALPTEPHQRKIGCFYSVFYKSFIKAFYNISKTLKTALKQRVFKTKTKYYECPALPAEPQKRCVSGFSTPEFVINRMGIKFYSLWFVSFNWRVDYDEIRYKFAQIVANIAFYQKPHTLCIRRVESRFARKIAEKTKRRLYRYPAFDDDIFIFDFHMKISRIGSRPPSAAFCPN